MKFNWQGLEEEKVWKQVRSTMKGGAGWQGELLPVTTTQYLTIWPQFLAGENGGGTWMRTANKSWTLFNRFVFCRGIGKQLWFYLRRNSGLSKLISVLMLRASILTVEGPRNYGMREAKRSLGIWRLQVEVCHELTISKICMCTMHVNIPGCACVCVHMCKYTHTFPSSLHWMT